jgi:N-acetylglucosamine kinase-like BadF-type ATPase
MKKNEITLGIEGGGTKTTWCLVDSQENVLAQGQVGAGNVSLLSDQNLKKLFLEIKRVLPGSPTQIGAGMAGVMRETDAHRVGRLLKAVFPTTKKIVVGEDSDSGFCAAHGARPGVLVIAGTGSNVLVSDGKRRVKVGGWGHIVSDGGSGWDIAQRGLRAAFAYYDETGKIEGLGKSFLKATQCKRLEDLAVWVLEAERGKKDVASLAKVVFAQAKINNLVAKRCLQEAVSDLTCRVLWGVKRLKIKSCEVAWIGGLFEKQPIYGMLFRRQLRKYQFFRRFFVCQTPGALGAARLVTLQKL